MDCLIDLDPTHRVLRATVTTRALTDEGVIEVVHSVDEAYHMLGVNSEDF